MKLLFVAPECHPLLKVGGLADVVGALPAALTARGHQVRVLLPRLAGMPPGREVCELPDGSLLHQVQVDGVQAWLLDSMRFRRRGSLYQQADGRAWDDDPECFDELARSACALADDRMGLDWRADVVHCHDWPSGLVPLRMMLERVPAASVFTIHNLAHQGVFDASVLSRLGLPRWLMHPDAIEYWGRISFMKAGLLFADRLTTVSPRYAREILTPQFGEGLDGVLRARAGQLDGILNGIDRKDWDPRHDPHIAESFGPRSLAGKQRCRVALLDEMGLSGGDESTPLLGWVGRLYAQKGVDLLLEALPTLVQHGFRLALLGNGDPVLERGLQWAAQRWPAQVAVRSGYDNPLAHRIHAGSDLFLMPSRFEPCGLTQLYAMRYGTLPVVHAVGGLADTVSDAGEEGRSGTGFTFHEATMGAMLDALARAQTLFAHSEHWQRLQRRAMAARFEWKQAAEAYLQSYQLASQRGLRQV